MTPYVSQYHGRGAAKLPMPRSNVEWKEIKFNRRFFLTGWLLFIKEGANLIYRLRFFFILFLLILIVINIVTSIEFIDTSKHIKLIKEQQAVNFILQPQQPLLEPEKAIITPTQPELKTIKPKPKPEKLPQKPKEKKKLNLEASLNTEKDFIHKQKKKEERKIRRIEPKIIEKKELKVKTLLNKEKEFVHEAKKKKPRKTRQNEPNLVEKKELKVKTPLNIEKDFIHKQKKKEERKIRRIEPKIIEKKELKVKTPSTIKADYISSVKKMEVSRMPRIEPESKERKQLNLVAALDTGEDFIQEHKEMKSNRLIREHRVDNDFENFSNNEDIEVDIKDTDFTAITQQENTEENILQRIDRTDDDNESIEGVEFSIKGESLETLKECGQLEIELKTRLAKLLQERGYIKKCMDKTGKYLFYWPKDRFTVENFNVIIYPAIGRDVLDRCEELNYAFRCLEKN
ncbi:MAG: hypothetical protein SWO11_06325 [Thermodesulfobacteriota bacterium]|nr:hypothetical protein [Thermodesulfobacteriota bacterium]